MSKVKLADCVSKHLLLTLASDSHAKMLDVAFTLGVVDLDAQVYGALTTRPGIGEQESDH